MSSTADKTYLELLARILATGERRATRNGETISTFGERIVFPDVAAEFPLLTTKRVYWKGVVEELLWFLAGSSDVSALRARGVHIWDGNSTRTYLDGLGLTAYSEHEEGGPIYGFQWRHFGAQYVDCHTDYTGQGVDQIAWIINEIRTNPASRRILLSAWNPPQLGAMILPPCHFSYQFYVNGGRLDCQMNMRSCDVFLGLPFNIASTAALMHLIAAICGLVPRKLVVVMGDTHIYAEHVDAVKEQAMREARAAPTLKIVGTLPDNLYGLTPDNFALEGYNPHATIKAPMAA